MGAHEGGRIQGVQLPQVMNYCFRPFLDYLSEAEAEMYKF